MDPECKNQNKAAYQRKPLSTEKVLFQRQRRLVSSPFFTFSSFGLESTPTKQSFRAHKKTTTDQGRTRAAPSHQPMGCRGGTRRVKQARTNTRRRTPTVQAKGRKCCKGAGISGLVKHCCATQTRVAVTLAKLHLNQLVAGLFAVFFHRHAEPAAFCCTASAHSPLAPLVVACGHEPLHHSLRLHPLTQGSRHTVHPEAASSQHCWTHFLGVERTALVSPQDTSTCPNLSPTAAGP